ncbi:MAG: shikimate dehydrogenase [Planctomycetota bacterium]|jgi:3-dehydroquinate dehydratase/shikimate dehydrogenase
MTYLAVSIFACEPGEFAEKVSNAKRIGAEAIEIRCDALAEPNIDAILKMIHSVQKCKLPVIVTCRDVSEGGVNPVDFSVRLSILKQAVEAKADFVDVEYENFKHPDTHSVLKAALETSDTKLILSCHNFKGPFDDLNILYETVLALHPDAIPKIVYKARHISDCFAAFDLLQEADRPLIAFCMGEDGLVSRALAKKFGSVLTFACLDDAAQTAPGQVSVQTMKQMYRWDAIDKDTEIFGVIGDPVGHSLSPALFNQSFEKKNINAVYLPFLVRGGNDEFNTFLDDACNRYKLGFGGFSVTLPHKTNALNYANRHGDYVDTLAQTIGSVNTLKIGFNGLISAYNTDYAGAMDAMASVFDGDRHSLHGKKVAVIGAGGVSRAVVAGLVDVGARVRIYNRTLSKAESLAKEFCCKFAGINELTEHTADVVVNCTSLGMCPDVETCPVPEGVLTEQMTVFDTVYNPLETKLLQMAKAAGAKTVNGAEMFIRQAMAQYKIYIGDDPDEELMRKVVYDKLGS